jgi:SAM-dependent methyltransferase
MIDLSIIKDDEPYELKGETLVFKQLDEAEMDDDFDRLKNRFKKYTKLYDFLIYLVSPVFSDNNADKFIKRNCISNKIAINIGSGNSKISKSVTNVDIFNYENVDIVCDIARLPFKDDSIDIILNIAVLEHVPNPQAVVNEIYRVLKPGGIVFTEFPFIQGFHASPYDFTRVTHEGIRTLHADFEEIEVKPFGGPTSGMLWVFQEWLAIVLSFGSKRLYMFFYLVMMFLTFPVKYLDLILIHYPMAKVISSGFVYIGNKRDTV